MRNNKLPASVRIIATLVVTVVLVIMANPILVSIRNWINTSLCETPLTYRVGTIDPDFNVSENDLLVFINEATDIWKKAYGKNLFVYDPSSDLEINLIFDERQENLTTLESLEEEVEQQRYTIEEQNAEYERRLEEIKKKAEDLNSEISYWNSKGGAPEDVYNDLTKRQDDLAQETKELNRIGDVLNRNVDKVNQDIQNLNDEVGNFNSLISSKPEIGYYTSGEHKIDVFFYSDEEYLVNTLAHELGHALGLGHINEPNSIMNPVISTETILTNADRSLINNYCSENNRIDLLRARINEYIYKVLERINSAN